MSRVAEIKNLLGTAEFHTLQEMGAASPRFNLLAVIDQTVTENAWSRILAFLFDSRRNHGLYKRAILTWLKLVDCDRKIVAVGERKDTGCVVENEWGAFDKRRLDLLIRFVDRDGETRAVVGIENKVWSGEQPEQLSHYQTALCQTFRGIPKVLVFLSPEERNPTTIDAKNLDCPCHPCRYESLIELCRSLNRLSLGRDVRFLLQHLESYMRDQMIESERGITRAKRLIRKLYQQRRYRNALRMIRDHLPSVGSVAEKLETRVDRKFMEIAPAGTLRWLHWPVRGVSPQEIKLIPEELTQFTFKNRWAFQINFMLRSSRPVPDIGDEFTFIVAAWCPNEAARQAVKALLLPDSIGAWQAHGRWEAIWTGETHRLVDLDEADLRGLERIMVRGLKKTYPILKRRVLRLFPKRRK